MRTRIRRLYPRPVPIHTEHHPFLLHIPVLDCYVHSVRCPETVCTSPDLVREVFPKVLLLIISGQGLAQRGQIFHEDALESRAVSSTIRFAHM
jgi:hypothetical protein